MDQNSPVTGLRALARKVALERAIKLSGPQAHEIWRAMRLLAINRSVEGLPGAVAQLAMDFNQFPVAWKVIAKKAFIYDRLAGKRKR